MISVARDKQKCYVKMKGVLLGTLIIEGYFFFRNGVYAINDCCLLGISCCQFVIELYTSLFYQLKNATRVVLVWIISAKYVVSTFLVSGIYISGFWCLHFWFLVSTFLVSGVYISGFWCLHFWFLVSTFLVSGVYISGFWCLHF